MKIRTGCAPLDELLGGGVESDCITLLFGEGGTGKTNLCIQLARNVVLSGKKVVFIDSEGVSPERLEQIAGDDHEKVVQNILFSEPYTHEEQERLVAQAIKLVEGNADIGLIIVDSATMHYRLAAAGPDWDDERRSLTRQVAHLLRVSRQSHIPVVLTSQVYTDVRKDTFEPLGGHILTHNAKVIVRLEKAGPNVRRAVIVKHRHVPEGRGVTFRLTERGVEA